MTPTISSKSLKSGMVHYGRFTPGQRALHAILMVTFLGLAATGFALRFSNSAWGAGFAHAVGGFAAILFFHKLCAVALTIAFIVHVADIVYRVLAKHEYGLVWGPDSLVPNLKDIQDFIGQIRWFFFRGPQPKFGRYAYWEKVDYWAVFWGMGIIGFSGYMMWYAPFFARFLPGSLLNVALLIHGEEALLAVSFIFTIHFFNEHLRPHNFPMDITIFTGSHSEAEFAERHPEEYAQALKSGQLESLRVAPPSPAATKVSRLVGASAVLIGLLLLVLTIVAYFQE